jgi:hypothetical protein
MTKARIQFVGGMAVFMAALNSQPSAEAPTIAAFDARRSSRRAFAVVQTLLRGYKSVTLKSGIMRHLIVTIVLVFAVLHPLNAQESGPPSPARPSANRSDVLADTLWRIAVAAHARIGFQFIDRPRFPSALKDTPSLGDWTLAQALDTAMAMDGRYDWHTVNGTIVVRPKTAWTDTADPLNRSIRNLNVEERTLADMIVGVRQFLYTNRVEFVRRNHALGHLALRVESGTMVDVLNSMTEAADMTMWTAYVGPFNDSPNDKDWDAIIDVRNTRILQGYSGTRRALFQARR